MSHADLTPEPAWSRALISTDTVGLARLRSDAMADHRGTQTGIGLPVTRAALGALTVGQDAYLKAFNTGQNDEFGRTVAVSGDRAVIGAPFESSGSPGSPSDNSAPGAGAAYVFVRGPGGWSQEAYLKASNPDTNDAFGSAVAAGMMMQPPNTAILAIDYAAPYAPALTGTRHFQHWFRSGTGTGPGFNTSNGLTVTF